MIIMIVMMVILMIMMKKLPKKHTNIMTFQQKSTNDDNDNCNDNYDSNDCNFDDYDEKMTKKHTNIMTFQQKCTNFRDFYLVKKGPKNLGIGKPTPPPPTHTLSGNARKFATFFSGCLPLGSREEYEAGRIGQ